MASIVFIPIVLTSATLYLYLLAKWGVTLVKSDDETSTDLFFPSNIDDLRVLSVALNKFYEHNVAYVLILFTSAYLYKQTFAIPGSVFLNLLAGAIFGLWPGFVIASILTATGASLCYMMVKTCAKKQIAKYFSKKLRLLQTKVEDNSHRLPYFLLFLRLFPITPNWFLNMASSVVGIPLPLFFFSVLIGLMPYNFICVQTGVILSQLKSHDDIFTFSTIIKLAIVASVALVPGLCVKKKSIYT